MSCLNKERLLEELYDKFRGLGLSDIDAQLAAEIELESYPDLQVVDEYNDYQDIPSED
tara:strand:+ start:429 stop:602 length:174 start_codon:yes stop_codon:yes gene_type:complete